MLRSGLEHVDDKEKSWECCQSPPEDAGPGDGQGVLVMDEDVEGEVEHGEG